VIARCGPHRMRWRNYPVWKTQVSHLEQQDLLIQYPILGFKG